MADPEDLIKIALISIVAGACLTSLPIRSTLMLTYNPIAPIYACLLAVIATICYGVDFPDSNKRFARLTG
jgi:hypothetical protein